MESVVTLPLVGPGRTRGWGGYRAPWVTFSFGPSETGLGYILKWLDTRATLGALNLRPEPREVLEERTHLSQDRLRCCDPHCRSGNATLTDPGTSYATIPWSRDFEQRCIPLRGER